MSRRDLEFLLHEWLQVTSLTARERFAEHSKQTFDAVLELGEVIATEHFGREILLEKPGPPAMSEQTAGQVRELLTKGATGGHLFFTTDDAQRTHAELKARGVELVEEPTERPYGTDFGLRDPFGNHIRISQPAAPPA